MIFISHKLDEVLRVSQRIAVLRGGKLVAVLPAAGADKALLAETMVGRQVQMPQRRPRAPGATVCRLQDASVTSADGRQLLDGVNLELRAGEIVAIAGVAGNGQQALAELLFGLHALSAGRLRAARAARCPRAPRDWVRAGVARIPEDRHAVGVVGDLPVWENAMLERYATPAFARAGVVKRARGAGPCAAADRALRRARPDAQGLDTPTRALSGGNMQKLILGRALVGDPGGDAAADADRRRPADLGPRHRRGRLRAPAAARRRARAARRCC